MKLGTIIRLIALLLILGYAGWQITRMVKCEMNGGWYARPFLRMPFCMENAR